MTEHEKLVERVARAICANLGHDWSEASQGVREICEECSTAAIAAVHAALQEPSEGMVEAAYRWHEPVEVTETYPVARGTWRAMIAASPLKEVDG